MPTPSPRLKIPIYTEADTPVDIPAAWTARTAILDKLVPIDTGTLAQRPPSSPGTAGIVGRQFITTGETDSPRLELDLGQSWIKIGPPVQDGAPTTPSVRTLGTGANQAVPGNDARLFSPGDLKMSASTLVQPGWLLCDGSAVNRVTYADLWNAIGSGYGAGDGSNTFNLPDLRSRVPLGAGQGAGLTLRALGQRGGEEVHTLTNAEMPSHSHGGGTGYQSADHAHAVNIQSGGESAAHAHGSNTGEDFVTHSLSGSPPGRLQFTASGGYPISAANATAGENAGHSHGVNGGTGGVNTNHYHAISADGSSAAHNLMSPYGVVNYFIKT